MYGYTYTCRYVNMCMCILHSYVYLICACMCTHAYLVGTRCILRVSLHKRVSACMYLCMLVYVCMYICMHGCSLSLSLSLSLCVCVCVCVCSAAILCFLTRLQLQHEAFHRSSASLLMGLCCCLRRTNRCQWPVLLHF
jgi:hypothetical protein